MSFIVKIILCSHIAWKNKVYWVVIKVELNLTNIKTYIEQQMNYLFNLHCKKISKIT